MHIPNRKVGILSQTGLVELPIRSLELRLRAFARFDVKSPRIREVVAAIIPCHLVDEVH